jgi:hypothetical protein
MKKLMQSLGLSLLLAASSWGSTFSLSGRLLSDVGFGLQPNSTFTGTLTLDGVGSDTDPSPENGDYAVNSGLLELFVVSGGSLIDLTLSFSSEDSGRFSILNEPGLDRFIASATPFFSDFFLSLVGSPDMFPNPAPADGLEALTSFNPSAFSGGNLTLNSFFISEATAEKNVAAAAGGNQAIFAIDSFTNVPEPGTVFGVAAGALVLFLKRRQSR